VQTGSFSTVARAEAVKDTLSAKGITSLVENREVQGKTYFRVRVGPYTSKNEADYWLALIKSIHGFEESLVFKTPAR
jgi:DedD protein